MEGDWVLLLLLFPCRLMSAPNLIGGRFHYVYSPRLIGAANLAE